MVKAGHGHVRTGQGIARSHDILAQTRHLHAIGHRITHHAQRVLQGHGCRSHSLFSGAAPHGDQGRSSHARSSTAFGLTPGHLSSKGRVRGNEHADHPGRQKGPRHVLVGQAQTIPCSQTRARQGRTGTSRGRSHNHAHGALDLHQRSHIGNDPVQQPGVEQVPLVEMLSERPGLGAQNTVLVLRALEPLFDRRPENPDDIQHARQHSRLGQIAALGFVIQTELPQGPVMVRLVRQHLPTGRKRHAQVPARQDRQHRGQLLDRLNGKP